MPKKSPLRQATQINISSNQRLFGYHNTTSTLIFLLHFHEISFSLCLVLLSALVAAHNDSNYLNGHCFVSLMPWRHFSGTAPGFLCVAGEIPLNQTGSAWKQFIPLFLFSFRWNIEASYYEQKTFWSLYIYMVRNRKRIEMLVNLINIT